MRKAPLTLALLASASLALSACSGAAPPGVSASADASADPTESVATDSVASEAAVSAPQSLPDALDNADGLQTVAEALKVTGIANSFQGPASYTLLAPEDDAFVALGSTEKTLFAAGDHAALTALLKDHLLPGHITPKDLGAAIDASPGGTVTISTLGGGLLTFTKANGTAAAPAAITVTAPDGSQATLDGDPVSGGSSLAIPITGMLGKVVAAS